MSTSHKIRSKPVMQLYKAGHEAAFGRKCRGCGGSMKREPAEATWCKRCKEDPQ